MKQQDSRTAPQRIRHARPEQCRRDGWTVRRQLAFLAVLQRTRSVTEAAKAAGMSRGSAYRLRGREPDGLFAASWARVFGPRLAITQAEIDEGHIRIMRLACGPEGNNLRVAPRHCQNRDLSELAEPSAVEQARRASNMAWKDSPGSR